MVESALAMVELEGVLLAGRYRVESRLSSGGMGVIFKGRDVKLDVPVAVKVLIDRSAEQQRLFEEETRALKSLRSDNVVRVLDRDLERTERFGPIQYLVTEFLEGSTLRELLDARGSLTPLETVKVARRIAKGLQDVHAAGLVHRDVKPENVMLELDRSNPAEFVRWLRLIDFGLAVAHGSRPNVPRGTPEYVAPEGVTGQLRYESDLYSLGIVMFEMLAGKKPFVDDDVRVLLDMHVRSPLPALRELAPQTSARLEQLVRTLAAKQPEARGSSARALMTELNAIEAELTVQPTYTGPSPLRMATTAELTRAIAPKRRGLWVGMALVVLMLLGVLWPSETATPVPVVAPAPIVVPAPAPLPPPTSGLEAMAPLTTPEAEVAPDVELAPVGMPPMAPRRPVMQEAPRLSAPVMVEAQVVAQNDASEAAVQCTFDERFQKYVRRTVGELREIGEPSSGVFVAAEDEVGAALVAQDCSRAMRALGALRKVAGAQEQ